MTESEGEGGTFARHSRFCEALRATDEKYQEFNDRIEILYFGFSSQTTPALQNVSY